MATRHPGAQRRAAHLRGEYPSLGPEGTKLVERFADDATLLAAPTTEQVLARWSALLERVNAHIVVVVGARGAEAIFRRAVKTASAAFPAVTAVRVQETGVVLEGLREQRLSAAEARRLLSHLLLSTMDVLASLVGVDLLAALLGRMARPAPGGKG